MVIWVFLDDSSSYRRSSFLILPWLSFEFVVGTQDALYEELWHACAGPLVTLPGIGERVFYFPQGHMEQV